MESDDSVLSTLDGSTIDELWLLAVDMGNGLTSDDCRGIARFHERGGGLLVMRDHQDLGSSLCTLGGVGRAHYSRSKTQEPDAARHVADDTGAPSEGLQSRRIERHRDPSVIGQLMVSGGRGFGGCR